MKKLILALLCAATPALALPNYVVQEGLLLNDEGVPLEGQHTIRVRLWDRADGGNILFEESHTVTLSDGWYAYAMGSEEALNPALFARAELHLAIAVDRGQDLTPRTALSRVPAAFTALDVEGAIHPTEVFIGNTRVINDQGQWVGDPVGLRGPAGPAGADGPRGPAGVAGGNADPAAVVPLVVEALEEDPGDLPFVRNDADDSKTGSLTMQGGAVVFPQANPVVNAIALNNNNVLGANLITFNDPGAGEGLRWNGSQASIDVAPLGGGNSDGMLRLNNDAGISLGSTVRAAGRLTMAAGADIVLADRQIRGVGDPGLVFADPGPDGAVLWTGTQAQIHVAPLDGSNSDGYLRLINDDGISLHSKVFVDGALGVGTSSPGARFEVRDDSAAETGMIVRNRRADTRTSSFVRLVGQTPANEETYGMLRLRSGTDAGGADARNEGALELVVSTGAAGAPRSAMMVQHDGDVGISTTSPLGRLHVSGADSRANPLVVSSVSPGLYLFDTEAAGGNLRYDSFGIEVDGNRFYIGARPKANAATPGSGNRKFTITNSGNVGINERSPAEQLVVRGDAIIDGDLTVTGRLLPEEPGPTTRAYAGQVAANATQRREREVANFTVNDHHWSRSNGFFVEAYSRYYDSGYVKYYVESGYRSKEIRKIESRGDLATRFGLRLVEDGVVGQRGGHPERRFRLYAQAEHYSQWHVFIETASMSIRTGDVTTDGQLGVKEDSGYSNVGGLSNSGRTNAMEGDLSVGGKLTTSGTIKHKRTAMNAARGICYSALHGNSNKSIIMVPLPDRNANLDGICHSRINGGWHAGGVAKGNYYYQNCPSDLENDSYGGGYTSYVTEGYFEGHRGNYTNCGPSNAFICCSPQFPN